MCISFDTTFNIGFFFLGGGGGAPPMQYGSVKSSMHERVKLYVALATCAYSDEVSLYQVTPM